jgi:hypothetical protein
MTLFILSIIVFIIGWTSHSIKSKISLYRSTKKSVDNIRNQYINVLNNIRGGYSSFHDRTNSIVYIKTNIIDHGDVDVLYYTTTGDISIFKDSKCIYTQHQISKEHIISDIVNEIKLKYDSKINDTIDFFGFTFYRPKFENLLTSQAKIQLNFPIQNPPKSDINKIVDKNNQKMSLDDILDKINEKGIDNLTPEEKKFLKNQK